MNVLEFRALDTDVRVECDDEAIHAAIHTVTASYPRATATPSLRYRLDRAQVWRNDVAIGSGATPNALVQAFASDLFPSVIDGAAPSFLVHSAAVVRAEGAVLLFGPSGAGKTTMSRALIARGARYVTDEFAAVDAELRVRGIPRPFEAAIEAPPGSEIERLSGVVHHFRLADGDRTIDSPMLVLAPAHIHTAPARIVAAVHLRHAPGDVAVAQRLSPAEGLARLWAERHRFGEYELQIAITLVRELGVHGLVTPSVDAACDALDKLLSGSPHRVTC